VRPSRRADMLDGAYAYTVGEETHMADCRAAVITEHNKPLQIQRVPIPELQPGALLVRIEVSTLCGTDVHRWHGPLGGGDSLPIITGHEPCGIVEAINGERTDILGNPVKPGERVVWSYVACGSCYYCSVALQPCICRNGRSRVVKRSRSSGLMSRIGCCGLRESAPRRQPL